jgi:Putative quorum-sensing-regulated virulence factor
LKLTAQQQTLIRIAMDRGANEYERDLAAAAFFQQLRRQYADGYALLSVFGNGSAPPARSVYGAVCMPFGKHKGRALSDIPTDYLIWLLDNATALSRQLRRAIETVVEEAQHNSNN